MEIGTLRSGPYSFHVVKQHKTGLLAKITAPTWYPRCGYGPSEVHWVWFRIRGGAVYPEITTNLQARQGSQNALMEALMFFTSHLTGLAEQPQSPSRADREAPASSGDGAAESQGSGDE